ncbi:DeoR/GlpR family DNA-binding transcription regulator [Falsirhodobacter sp. 20TX0035]|uniref:DeoR/GlpR family DNA-binding transcription regulator n=1 Tax=Falsirhodobacter sp. 20TX0035 TaxID=3022019 RepID=UPI00232CCCAD|nr:DeoR/GlpR family DNA-binding transcription regulator [Falsirhodobacter sp. 20TX0035]MDB6453714.1 DeoR/GlpR family DNA-binding transcription regulator [Falsirhodobacter sp. 20TX0035]
MANFGEAATFSTQRGGDRMWRAERERLIAQRLDSRGRVSIAELVRDTGVSRETLRADLEALAATGRIRRVRGGAVVATGAEPAFEERMHHRTAEKLAIGRAAAALLPGGASVMIDAGSTTAALGRALVERPDLRIITNSLQIARDLAPTHDVFLLGGVPDAPAQGLFGEMTLSQLRRFRADVAVISPVGVDPQVGLSNFKLPEAELARAMFAAAERRMALAQAEKLGHRSRDVIAPLSALDWLVTDAAPPQGWPLLPGWTCVGG